MKDRLLGCYICTYQPDPTMILAENEHWRAALRDNDQTLLGTTILTARRHVHELHHLTASEFVAMGAMIQVVFGAIETVFKPQTINTSCLKNNVFTAHDVPPEAGHVHWHIKPRYAGPVEFAGQVFTDPMPGRYLTTFDRVDPPIGVARAIAGALKIHMHP